MVQPGQMVLGEAGVGVGQAEGLVRPHLYVGVQSGGELLDRQTTGGVRGVNVEERLVSRRRRTLWYFAAFTLF